MSIDPKESTIDEEATETQPKEHEFVSTIESSDEWTLWRDNLAKEMYEGKGNRRG